jgi:hypothetical protein
VRTSLRSINGAHEFSNSLVALIAFHSERIREIPWQRAAATTRDPSTSLSSAQHDGKPQTKPVTLRPALAPELAAASVSHGVSEWVLVWLLLSDSQLPWQLGSMLACQSL